MKILMTTVVGAAVALAGCSAGSRESQADNDVKLLVGSYCEPGDSALRVFSFNEADTSGRLLYTVDVDNASFFRHLRERSTLLPSAVTVIRI